jgi:dihydrofolate reductase
MLPLKLIASIDSKRGIAKDGSIPWQLQGDMRYFRGMTLYSNVLMGWDTFVSIGKEPLPNRTNYILTQRHVTLREDCEVIHNLKSFLGRFREDLWVVGGAKVFEQTLPTATHLYVTRINKDFGCDEFFPAFEDKFKMISCSQEIEENGVMYRFEIWVRKDS